MDRQFISYPKSGRTWVRYALTKLGVAQNIHFHHDGFEFNDGSKPPHNFNLNDRLQYYSSVDRVVYLERDPRDVMVSLYFQVTGRFDDFFHYKEDLSTFIKDEYFGAHNLQHFRSLWDEICASGNALKISYEDCHANMGKVLTEVVDYYEFDVTGEAITRAVEESSFENMRRVEESGQFSEPWMRPRRNSFKVRRGKVGGFVDHLSDSDIRYLNDVFELNE